MIRRPPNRIQRKQNQQNRKPVKSEPAKSDPVKSEPKTDSAPAGGAKTSPDKSAPILTQPITDPFKATPAPDSPTGKTIDKIPVTEYEPLDKPRVHNQIRDTLARAKAEARIEELFNKIAGRIKSYSAKLSVWRARKESAEPAPPDFQAIAKEFGVKYHATKPISILDAMENNEIGKSLLDKMQDRPFVHLAFAPTLPVFKPFTSRSSDKENAYLWWRANYHEAFVPEFAKARPEVLASWKMSEARKLALAKAKEYVTEVTERRGELKDLFATRANLNVKQLGPFPWMTRGSVPAQPGQPVPLGRTELPDLDKVGNEFMRTVFSLDAGAAGVAWNEPQTIVYVVQVIKFDPAESGSRRDFLLRMATRDDSMQAAHDEASNTIEEKVRAIEKEYGVKVLQTADVAEKNAATEPVDNSDNSDN